MAKLYHRNNVLEGWRRDAAEEAVFPIPIDASVIEFDMETNPGLVQALDSDWDSFSVVAGVLQRNGAPVAIAADGSSETERKAAINAVQLMQEYRALASPSSAQTVGIVKIICRVLIWILVNRIKP